MFRQVVSGLVILGLLLLSASSVLAVPRGHAHAAGIAQAVGLTVQVSDRTGDCCPHDGMTDAACCLNSVCMVVPVAFQTHAFARSAPTPVRYCKRSDANTGLTPEPDLGPPISRG